ncbi:acetyl/propionyl-CoA carboxylase, alpha subunit [Longilinea arvoryzae]|uniref:Acetyl/propionyl-CoA carboxylase, alpha subunit n=1 Tax=Longilinea arvoryzae TaxID=360412 RepID=A0A0S7BMY4_9CHLR|nr:biotin/lipoyl-containing protein [Longilinea arvoryzae]GAP15656.1 acetyl/propionyl-CoA carboxylase, alpha subunit [Longilinea arvoryzae]
MIVRVKVQNKEYEVEISDLNARPVLATVEGQTFEVWPEEAVAASTPAPAAAPVAARPEVEKPARPAAAPANGGSSSANAVTAPIPGVIVAIAVKEGQSVAQGEELLTLEAMKMKNAIRAERAGKIGAIKVSVGDHVRHGQVLVEYSA